MLLSALYDYAIEKNLLAGRFFQRRTLRWIIPLDADGSLRGDGLIDLADKEHPRGVEQLCPATVRAKTAGGVAEFLCDGLTSVFGADPNPDNAAELSPEQQIARYDNRLAKFRDFWRQIQDCHSATDSPVAAAMLAFLRRTLSLDGKRLPPFLRWGVATDSTDGGNNRWWVRSAGGKEVPMKPGDAFTLKIAGVTAIADPQLCRHWARVAEKERLDQERSAARGLCLVTGCPDAPIANTHPKIDRVGQAMGSSLVSFSSIAAGEVCSFASYGKRKGGNAPISQRAAEAYGLALNHMLSDRRHTVRIGPTFAVFWAGRHEAFTDGVADLLEKPYPEYAADFFRQWLSAGMPSDAATDRFYCVILTGNAGRITVRHWIDLSLQGAASGLAQWFEDLALDLIPSGPREASANPAKARGVPPLAFFRLACATVRDAKDIKADLLAQLCRAAFQGLPVPLALLIPILRRLRCDLAQRDKAFPMNSSRFSLIKLILIRNRKAGDFMPQCTLSDTDDVPYNLGRLLAILEGLQDKAYEYQLKGGGAIERYYGSASSSPAATFPLLLRLARHRLHQLRRRGRKGAMDAHFIEKALQDILARVVCPCSDQPPAFPRAMGLEQQGRFALGFYQQKAHESQARAEFKVKKNQRHRSSTEKE